METILIEDKRISIKEELKETARLAGALAGLWTAVFIAAKLKGKMECSWLYVLAPTGIVIGILVLTILLVSAFKE